MSDQEWGAQVFSRDNFALECTGDAIDGAGPGYGRCVLHIQPKRCSELGQSVGSASFTLSGWAFTAFSSSSGGLSATHSSRTAFLSPAKGAVPTAGHRRAKGGRTACFCRTSVTGELGTPVTYLTSSDLAATAKPGQ